MTEPRRSARLLVRRWWPLALAVPLGAAAGAGYAVVAHPSYAADSYVIVVSENPGESATAVNFAQAYGRLAGRPQVLAAAAAETGHSRSELEALVHGTTSPDAPMIEITGTGADPQEAVLTADAVARSLVTFANGSTKETGVRLVPLAAAAEPERPTTPSGRLDVAVGGAAGVLIGALVMMTRRRSDSAAGPAAGAAPVPTAPRPRTAEPGAEPVAGPGPEPRPEAGTEVTAEVTAASGTGDTAARAGKPDRAGKAGPAADAAPAKSENRTKTVAGSGR
ncbi:hypothetical protein PUR61_34360 [Streptomyces sp. BE20]|uniref:hypothetical protein n=1 Tax=Streptomyces sp. BE20 TaxID=3002525 RepID=UPI002E782010|nr:hypothetical protein [Streptomyces sp. BE20]MEE1827236.1 hypothetical protein [Streptomyces sp. BE20]